METIRIEVKISSDINNVWTKWTEGHHIKIWYFASEDWHVPSVEQNFCVGEAFVYRMEAKDGSMGFDFSGKFVEVVENKSITYVLDDDRKVITLFDKSNDAIHIVQEFEAEDELSAELQRQGWQAILNQFKRYVEQQ